MAGLLEQDSGLGWPTIRSLPYVILLSQRLCTKLRLHPIADAVSLDTVCPHLGYEQQTG